MKLTKISGHKITMHLGYGKSYNHTFTIIKVRYELLYFC